jgi:hypothetical protein
MEPFEPGDEPTDDHDADRYLGALTGLYEGFDLDALRDEWERPADE